MNNTVNYNVNKRIMNELCQEIKTLWKEKESRMWTELIKNIDKKQDSEDLCRGITKMRGLNKKKKGGNIKNEDERVFSTEIEKAEGGPPTFMPS